MQMNSFSSYSQFIAGCIIYGMVGIFLSNIHDMQVGSIIFYRLSFGLIILGFYLGIRGGLGQLRLKGNKRYLVLLGVLNVFTMFSYFMAIKSINVSVAVLLLYTAPIYVTLLAPVILNERIALLGIVALFLSIAGVILVTRPDGGFGSLELGGNYLIGLMFGMVSGLSFAFIIFTVRYIRGDYSGISQLFWASLVSIVVLFPYGFSVSIPVFVSNVHVLILFGLSSTAIGSLLYVNGLANIEAHKGSILALIEPVSVIFFAYFILNDPITRNMLLGCFLILAGAGLAMVEKKEYPLPEDGLI